MVDLIINKSVPQRWGFLILGLLCIALAGCWDGMSKTGVDETEPGEIQLQLEWLTDTDGFTAKQSPSGDVCIDFLIENIRVRVVSSANSTVASQEWPCSFHSGTLSDIPPGSGYSVEVDGLIGDQVQWHGGAVDVTVTSGQSTGPISIEMSYVGNDDTPPTVDSTSPVDQSDNIATNTAITIVFNEAVVTASVDAASITVTFGPDTVAGTVSYDPVTYTAVFQPQQELAVATTYTVTVTTDVMDLAGHNMEQDYPFSFTTTTVWYVDGNSPSSGTGQSWVEAFNNISDAVAAAGSGDQLWVLATNYVLTGTINVNKVVSIFGGFDGTESHLSQRDWQSNITVIDGNTTVRCLFVNDDATFDGLTIRNGRITGPTPAPEGSGMFIDIASPTIVNCTFSENVAGPSDAKGGALYISNGSPIISNCLFQDNQVNGASEGFGGAIYNYQGSPTISNCTFVGNQTSGAFGNFGGAIFNDVSTPIIRDCIFTQNRCFGDTGEGGAINNLTSDVVIERCTFSENSAGGMGGYGGAISNKQSGNVTITNCIFDRNSASGAGGTGQGGAVANRFNGTATITITNCSFALNRTTGGGGDYGGAVYNQDSDPTLANCILWDNTATNGSQIYDEPPDASSTVVYSVIDQAGYEGINNNIRRNPMFGANLHLRTNSPCIGQGDNTAAPANDVDGETRPQLAVVDIGADEFLDTDGDQMPDYWEIQYDLDKDLIDAGGDPDGDLLTNLSEYQIDTDPQGANVVLNAVNRGWWDITGFHDQTDNSTTIGRGPITTYRSYFSFDLSGVSGSVTRAALRLELVSYDSIISSETIEIWDVSTPAATLEASATGQTAIYDDLGTGNRYTGWTVTPPDEGDTLEFYLNTQAVSDIDGAVGNAFSVGTALESLSLDQTLDFSSGSEARTHQLVLTTE